ncbi:MAG: hypothetical protein M3Q36_00765 [bacterium]|nr:hypothetical protein [bacterium]
MNNKTQKKIITPGRFFGDNGRAKTHDNMVLGNPVEFGRGYRRESGKALAKIAIAAAVVVPGGSWLLQNFETVDKTKLNNIVPGGIDGQSQDGANIAVEPAVYEIRSHESEARDTP